MTGKTVLPLDAWNGAGPLDVIIDGGVLLDVAHRTRCAVPDVAVEIGRLTGARRARVVLSPDQRNRAERVEQVLFDIWRAEELVTQADDVTARIIALAHRHPAAVIVAGIRVRAHLDRAGLDSTVVVPRRRRQTWVLDEVAPAATSAVLSQISDAMRRRGDGPLPTVSVWACVNPDCDECRAHPAHLVRDPTVSAAGSVECPSCGLPVVAVGEQHRTVGLWLTGPDGTRRLIRVAAGETLVLGRTMGSGVYGLDRLGLSDEISSRVSRRHLRLRVTKRGRRGRLVVHATDAGATNGTTVVSGSHRSYLGEKPVELDDRTRLELPGGITVRRSGARSAVSGP